MAHTTAQTFLIVDEVDYQCLDQLHNLPKAASILGLTATAFNDPKGAERAFLEGKLHAKVHDSDICSNSLNRNPVLEVENFDGFFDRTNDEDAKLIFAEASAYEHIKKVAEVYGYLDVLENCTNAVIISNIGRRVLMVTPECEMFMRGVDYRSSHISLLIAASFSNDRAYQQALGRVGRYDYQCDRFILRGVVPVDAAAQMKKQGELVQIQLRGYQRLPKSQLTYQASVD